MSRYGVMADVHANLRGLRAVTDALQQKGVSQLLCAGDLVGYNAWPEACVTALRSANAQVIAGNHDRIAVKRLGFERCSPKAAYALRRTRARADAECARFLQSLPEALLVEKSLLMVHGSLDDVSEYLTSPTAIARNCAAMRRRYPSARLCFFGHTHLARVYRIDGEEVVELDSAGPIALDLARYQYFINPGSVDGARREEHQRAEYAIFDFEASTIELCGVPYDHQAEERDAVRGGYRMGPMRAWASTQWRNTRRTILRALRKALPRRS